LAPLRDSSSGVRKQAVPVELSKGTIVGALSDGLIYVVDSLDRERIGRGVTKGLPIVPST